MASIEVKNEKGKSAGQVELGKKLTEASTSHVSVHRAVVAEEANQRQGTQSALTRSEVRGGGRKPYKQKKTGNARQGSIRSPHYRHGGMALAVKPRDYDKKVNRKERRGAILTALASQIAAENVTVIDAISFKAPKTREASALLSALGLAEVKRLLVVLPAHDDAAYKSFRNLPNVTVRTAPAGKVAKGEQEKASAFSARDVLVAHKVLIAKDALGKIEEVWGK